MNKLTVLDLFAGAGGMSLGLGLAGLDIVGAVESDADAAKTYRGSHVNARLLECDIRSLLTEGHQQVLLDQFKGIDVVVGGPPCQGFSGINRHRRLDDPRNSLVESFFAVIGKIQPIAFVMENVPGLASIGGGSVLRELQLLAGELGYEVSTMVLQCGAFGVPQNRWRLFLIGHRSSKVEAPLPLHVFPKTSLFDVKCQSIEVVRSAGSESLFNQALPFVTVRDAIADLPCLENGSMFEGSFTMEVSSAYAKAMRGGQTIVNNHRCSRLAGDNLLRAQALPYPNPNGWYELPTHLQPKNLAKLGELRYRNRFGRLHWDYVFNTVVRKPEPYWGRVIHPDSNRLISVRESARAQGFPDSVEFIGKTLGSLYGQVGNAVPPPVGRAIGWELRKAMGDKTVEQEVEAYRRQMQA